MAQQTKATGIFQSAIVVRTAIVQALKEVRERPELIQDALASLPQDELTAGRYGDKTVEECRRWFTGVKVSVKLGVSLTQLTSPCVSVAMAGGEEAEATLGDVNYEPSEDDPYSPGDSRGLASVHHRETVNVQVFVQGEPEYLLFLSSVLLFAVLRHKEDLLDARGFTRLSWGTGALGAMEDVPGRENFFTQTLRFTGYVRHCWPVPLQLGQPAGRIEDVSFGPRVAHPGEGPVTPLPDGQDPFSTDDWLDRDVLSGRKT